MNIESLKNPVYSKADNSQIDCILISNTGQEFPFTARADDVMDYGVQLFNDLLAGKYGAIAAYVEPQQ